MNGARIGRRGLAELRDDLSGRDIAIVRQVSDLKLMSGRQIEAIHFTIADHASVETAARSARRVLERLVRDRLLIRLERRVGGVRAGSASYVYAIGPIGQRVVGSQGPRHRFREPSMTFALHTLAVSEFIVRLTHHARVGNIELLTLQPEPSCWRSLVGPMGASVLRPDLFTMIGVGDYEHRWFIEIDLGTEHLPTLMRKCQAYQTYFAAGTEQSAHGVFPRVLWQMHTTERAQRLRNAIDEDRRLTAELFKVTTPDRAVAVLHGGDA
jgi:hypothetical protein